MNPRRHLTPEEAENLLVHFGEHRGRTLREIRDEAPEHLRWLLQRSWVKGTLRTGVVLLLANQKP